MSKTQVPLSQIRDNPHQPRMDVGDVESLAESILQHGVRQLPEGRLVVDGDQPSYSEYTTAESGTWYLNQDEYAIVELASGHRRTEAIRLLNEDDTVTDGDLKGAGLVPGYVPVDLQRLSDEEMLDLGTIENVQREGLSPIEEARQIQEHKRFGRTNAEIGEIFGGRSSSWVSNRTRLLQLPQEVQVAVHEGEISTRQGQALARAYQLKEEHPDRVENMPFHSLPSTLVEDAKQGTSSEEIREKVQTMEDTIEAKQAVEDLPNGWTWDADVNEEANCRAVRRYDDWKANGTEIWIVAKGDSPDEAIDQAIHFDSHFVDADPSEQLVEDGEVVKGLPDGWVWVAESAKTEGPPTYTPYHFVDGSVDDTGEVREWAAGKDPSTRAETAWKMHRDANSNTDTDESRTIENNPAEDDDMDAQSPTGARRDEHTRVEPGVESRERAVDRPSEVSGADAQNDQTTSEASSGASSRIVLVACSKSKATMAHQAQALYKGQLFQKSKAYAQQLVEQGEADDWYILSAKHGLLEPMETVEPYNHTLADETDEYKEQWAQEVIGDLLHYKVHEADDLGMPVEIEVLAGKDYWQPLKKRVDEIRLDVPLEPHFRGMAGNGEMMRWLDERTEEDVYTEPTAREMREQPSGDGALAEATESDSGHDIGDRYGDIEMAMASCEDAGFSWHVGTKAQGGYYAHVTDHDDEVHEVEGGDTAAGALFDAYMAAKEDTDPIGTVDPDTVDRLLSADGIDMWDETVAAEASIPSLLVAHRVAGARQETWRTRLIAEAVQEREGTVTEEDIPDETMADVEAEVERRLEAQAA